MNAHAPIMPRTGFKFMLTVRDGPDAGTSFQLLPPKVSIGRGSDCDVMLNDPRVSRTAAVIEFSMERITIRDVSGRRTLFVNNDNIEAANLKDGDLLLIGETEMAFFVEAIALAPPRPQLGGQALGAPAGGVASGPPPSLGNFSGDSSKTRFWMFVGILVLGFIWLMTSKNGPKPKEQGLKTVDEIESEIKESKKNIEEITTKRQFNDENERTRFEEANKHFQEGFRDYEKGQWARAMRSFETAKTIDPKHPLASRYYTLAQKERDEMIATLTLEGRRYREKSMFVRCSAQFEKVLDMIPDHNDVKYKEAETLKKECDTNLEGRFRY